MKIEISKINEILKSLKKIQYEFRVVAENKDDDFGKEDNYDNEPEKSTIYDIGMKDLYLKIVEYSDSYGNERGIDSIQFVKPIVKQVTDFEII